MRKLAALLIMLTAFGLTARPAAAGGWHGPPCPATHYWHLSSRAYSQWREFGLFKGSWGERHKVVRRHRGAVVVKVWRPWQIGLCERR